jgi:hypothetical protein
VTRTLAPGILSLARLSMSFRISAEREGWLCLRASLAQVLDHDEAREAGPEAVDFLERLEADGGIEPAGPQVARIRMGRSLPGRRPRSRATSSGAGGLRATRQAVRWGIGGR